MHSTATQQNPIYCKYNHNKSNENIQSIASSKIHLWHAWNEIFESIFQNTHTHTALEAIKKDAFKPKLQTNSDWLCGNHLSFYIQMSCIPLQSWRLWSEKCTHTPVNHCGYYFCIHKVRISFIVILRRISNSPVLLWFICS